jgi:peptidoglycan/xylan/chitin deacetylase (PgdA/CDA1 family)
MVGSRVRAGELGGYYVDLRFKAEEPRWPPPWLPPREFRLHVYAAQWGLGCFERHLMGEGEEWLAAARGVGEYLIGEQERGGPHDGAWLHGMSMPHTYLLRPPWISAMAQGEIASLLVRLYRETGEERFAAAALRGLRLLAVPSSAGGARALLGGGPFLEEYPTNPPSFVLNGGIFALWGLYDVGIGLDDPDATRDFADGIETLARNIGRWDTGYWSLYDLFPHPLPNVASTAYHGLHTTQLRAMQLIIPRPEFERTLARFESYSRSRLNVGRAFALKSLFRIIVPRNRVLAHRLPWSEAQRGRPPKRRRIGHGLVLAYHAVSERWPSELAVSPGRLRQQLELLLRRGYVGATFAEVVRGEAAAKTVAVTFDDGFRSVHRHALSVLSELGLPATVFVPTGLMGRRPPMRWRGIDEWVGTPYEEELTPLSWDELRLLRDAGWEVASHTVSHARLTQLNDEALASELSESRQRCAREMGRPCESLAYPYGDHDERVRAAARDAGYAAAASIRPGPPNLFSWPRIGVYPVDDRLRFRLKASPTVRRVRSSQLGRTLERVTRVTDAHPN